MKIKVRRHNVIFDGCKAYGCDAGSSWWVTHRTDVLGGGMLVVIWPHAWQHDSVPLNRQFSLSYPYPDDDGPVLMWNVYRLTSMGGFDRIPTILSAAVCITFNRLAVRIESSRKVFRYSISRQWFPPGTEGTTYSLRANGYMLTEDEIVPFCVGVARAMSVQLAKQVDSGETREIETGVQRVP